MSALLRVVSAVTLVASCEYVRKCNVREYDDSMWRSHLCTHGRALIQSCGTCTTNVIARVVRRWPAVS